jgi:hypothetical protein
LVGLVFRLLGKGGVGEAYRVDDLSLGEPTALTFSTSLGCSIASKMTFGSAQGS